MAAHPQQSRRSSSQTTPRPEKRAALRLRIAGAIGALFAGGALLSHILFGLPYLLLLGGGAIALTVGTGVTVVRSDPFVRQVLLRIASGGALAGLVATVTYDLAKWGLSRLDPTPINPFEALPVFGSLVIGSDAPIGLLWAIGSGIHVFNGVTFGIAFAFLLGGRGVPAGIAWGLGLEMFQLTLYPGWLGIEAFREFATVSAGGHVVYGAVLGALERRLRAAAFLPHLPERSIR